MENRSHALIAGLFTLVFALAAVLAVWWFSGSREAMRTYLLETRGNLTGLNVQAQVRYRGIRAGKVASIRPDPADPGVLLAEITVGEQYPLTDRTVARLNQQGITGLAYVMLEEGRAGTGAPLVGKDGQPPRIAIQPGMLDNLGSKAGDIAAQVAELSVRLNRLLDERNLTNAATTLENLSVASAGLRELPALVASLRAVVSDENLARLRGTLAQVEAAAGHAAPLAQEVRQLVQTLTGLTQKIERAVGEAERTGSRLNADTLPRAEGLADELAATTRRLDRLLQTIERSPQSLIFGKPPVAPGPGEAGQAPPQAITGGLK
jgi:phospholipid/cholesterol/gamma-HCH transport system substrate-binding protein